MKARGKECERFRGEKCDMRPINANAIIFVFALWAFPSISLAHVLVRHQRAADNGLVSFVGCKLSKLTSGHGRNQVVCSSQRPKVLFDVSKMRVEQYGIFPDVNTSKDVGMEQTYFNGGADLRALYHRSPSTAMSAGTFWRVIFFLSRYSTKSSMTSKEEFIS
eukprot:131414-Hanusia_phi.AAC.1